MGRVVHLALEKAASLSDMSRAGVTRAVSEMGDVTFEGLLGTYRYGPAETREPPRTSTFVEVDEVELDGRESRIFTGWMFAESPGLHAVEHPVFDVWLTNCKTPEGSKPAESAANAPEAAAPPAAAAPEPKPAPAPAPAAAAPRPRPAPPPAAAAEPTLPWLTPNAPSKRH